MMQRSTLVVCCAQVTVESGIVHDKLSCSNIYNPWSNACNTCSVLKEHAAYRTLLLLPPQSLLAVTASDTKAKDRDLAHGVLATPLTINGCGFVPQVAIADIRVTARKQFNWGVEKLASPESLSLKYDQQGLVK